MEKSAVAGQVAESILSRLDPTGVLVVALFCGGIFTLGLLGYVVWRLHHMTRHLDRNGEQAEQVSQVVRQVNRAVNDRPEGAPRLVEMVATVVDRLDQVHSMLWGLRDDVGKVEVRVTQLERDQAALEQTVEEGAAS